MMIDPAFTLEKKTAIVVDAPNGIGRATTLAFAELKDIQRSHRDELRA